MLLARRGMTTIQGDKVSTDTQNFKPIYDELFKAISEIDEFLDSVSDQKSAGKRAVTNALVNE